MYTIEVDQISEKEPVELQEKTRPMQFEDALLMTSNISPLHCFIISKLKKIHSQRLENSIIS